MFHFDKHISPGLIDLHIMFPLFQIREAPRILEGGTAPCIQGREDQGSGQRDQDHPLRARHRLQGQGEEVPEPAETKTTRIQCERQHRDVTAASSGLNL